MLAGESHVPAFEASHILSWQFHCKIKEYQFSEKSLLLLYLERKRGQCRFLFMALRPPYKQWKSYVIIRIASKFVYVGWWLVYSEAVLEPHGLLVRGGWGGHRPARKWLISISIRSEVHQNRSWWSLRVWELLESICIGSVWSYSLPIDSRLSLRIYWCKSVM